MVEIASTPIAPPSDRSELLYLQSSQARNWRFSARQIEKMRREGHAAARKRIEELWALERSLPAAENEPEASSSTTPIDTLSIDEEQMLIAYYLTRVRQLVKAFGLPEVVEATTITFIKRFYLRNTCMDYHPKNIMLTCLFLAAKAESHAVPLRHFASKLAGKDPLPNVVNEYVKTVQDLEFFVSQSLAFEYTVHGAHRALHGAFLDIQSLPAAAKPTQEMLSEILTAARAEVQKSRFTDAELIYTPSQIALTSIYGVSKETKELVRQYVQEKEQRATVARQQAKREREEWRAAERVRLERKGVKVNELPSHLAENGMQEEDRRRALGMSTEEILELIESIAEMIRVQGARATDNVETVRVVDKKLKTCQNPEKTTTSRIAQKRIKEKELPLRQQQLGKRNANGMNTSVGNSFVDEEDDDEDDDVENVPNAKRVKVEEPNGQA